MKMRIAAVQTDVMLADVEANLQQMLRTLERPELSGCRLVVFPECMLTGYCFDSREEAWPHAELLPGPSSRRLAEHCREHRRWVVYGMLERTDGGKLYNSCALVGPDGVVGVYRKIHLPHLGIDRFVDPGPDPYTVWEIDGVRVGMHICYDGSFPESARCLALAGADVLVLPTNWPPGAETFAQYLPNARALENNVYYVSCDRIGTERGFRFIGQSRICDTNGVTMVEAAHTDPAILVADIDPARARNKRAVRVPRLHVIDRFADRRPEFYGPILQPHRLVRSIDDEA